MKPNALNGVGGEQGEIDGGMSTVRQRPGVHCDAVAQVATG